MLLTAAMTSVSAAEADSVSRARVNPYIPSLLFGAGAFGTGVVTHYAYPHSFEASVKSRHMKLPVQFAPLALPWVAKAAGVETRSGWGRMAVSQGAAVAITAGLVEGMKHSVTSLRPDGSDTHSFPSGHTAWAFMGATAAAHELAGTSAWYAMGAYAVASGVAMERVIDGRHYPSDVMAGAGIGIVSTELGYLIGDLIFGRRQLNGITGRDLRGNSNFSFLSLATGLNLPLGRVSSGGQVINRLAALSVAFRGGWAIDERWGVALEAGWLSTPLLFDDGGRKALLKSMNSVGLTVGPTYTCVLSNRLSLTADVAAGYRHNFTPDITDHAIRPGSGTAVGRADMGCVVRFTDRFSTRASVGYEISHYRFTLSPSEQLHITSRSTTSGAAHSLLVSISSRYEF